MGPAAGGVFTEQTESNGKNIDNTLEIKTVSSAIRRGAELNQSQMASWLKVVCVHLFPTPWSDIDAYGFDLQVKPTSVWMKHKWPWQIVSIWWAGVKKRLWQRISRMKQINRINLDPALPQSLVEMPFWVFN